LKYARSRHSTSDFDRSLRQQEILSSLKNKALSLGYFRDSIKIRDLYSAIKKYVETDIDISTLLKLALEFKASQDKELLSFNLNDTCYTGSPICSK
jgi:anionic cell wall polymer biosynthesis LytR-Cps2A-Psr (LCP) family protein